MKVTPKEPGNTLPDAAALKTDNTYKQADIESDEMNSNGETDLENTLLTEETSNFNWYQPLRTSGAYAGLRRFIRGDKVNTYSVSLQENENEYFVAKFEGQYILNGGKTLTIILLGFVTLAF